MRQSDRGEYVTYDELREKVQQLEKERDYYKDLLDSKLKFGIIIGLTNSYPNDQELGAKVREFIKLQEK